MATFEWLGAQHRPTWVPTSCVLPRWLTLRAGKTALVVVAPHGGRRGKPISRSDAVNDLATATLAAELARRLDAHALINHGLDRNRSDLNRTSALEQDSSSVVELLAAAVRAASTDGAPVLVVFVHGWNMVSPCCDIGVGLREIDSRLFGRNPTLGRHAWSTQVQRLRTALHHRGITASVGRRYPASGVDNAAQIFSGRHADSDNAHVAELSAAAAAGRVGAVQLELGISLRQPGGLRAEFIDAVVEAFGPQDSHAGAATVAPAVVEREKDWSLSPIRKGWLDTAGMDPGFGLQACWNQGEAALFCGVEPAGPRSMSARFSLVIPGGPMFLLVGEGPWDTTPGLFSLEGFYWNSKNPEQWRLRVDGWMIRYPDHNAYLDLESGLAGGTVVWAKADLSFAPDQPGADAGGQGHLQGNIEVDGFAFEISTAAVSDRRGRASATGARMTVRVWDDDCIDVLVAENQASELDALPSRFNQAELRQTDYEVAGSDGQVLQVEEMESGHDVSGDLSQMKLRLSAADSSALAEGRVVARVPVWRPVGKSLLVRWSFGVVQWQQKGPQGKLLAGLFDRIELFRA